MSHKLSCCLTARMVYSLSVDVGSQYCKILLLDFAYRMFAGRSGCQKKGSQGDPIALIPPSDLVSIGPKTDWSKDSNLYPISLDQWSRYACVWRRVRGLPPCSTCARSLANFLVGVWDVDLVSDVLDFWRKCMQMCFECFESISETSARSVSGTSWPWSLARSFLVRPAENTF